MTDSNQAAAAAAAAALKAETGSKASRATEGGAGAEQPPEPMEVESGSKDAASPKDIQIKHGELELEEIWKFQFGTICVAHT